MNFTPQQEPMQSPLSWQGALAFGVLFGLTTAACGGQATDVESQTSIDVAPVSSLDRTLPPQSIVDDDGKQCPRAKFKTIQAALDVAKNGDTILVCAGKYNETPVVSKTVTLLGAQHGVDARTRKASAAAETLIITDGFDVSADKVVFDGFSLQAAFMADEDTAYGLFLHEDHSGYRVVNNIMGGSAGSLFLGSSGAIQTEISHNKFSGGGVFADSDEPSVHAHNELIEENLFDEALLSFGGPGHSKLRILNNELIRGSSLTLADNVFPTGGAAIVDVSVQGNKIEKPGEAPAISLRHVQDSEFLNNTLQDGNAAGIAIVGSNSDVYLGGNVISGFGGSAIQVGLLPPSGLDQELTTGLTVDANQLSHNLYGLALLSAKGNTFAQNTIAHSKAVGIDVDATSLLNTFERNTVSTSKQRDCQDKSADGGTSHTHDTWTQDVGSTSSPAGLCVTK
jgi:hypothetical protein